MSPTHLPTFIFVKVDFTLALREYMKKEKITTVESAFSKVSKGKNSISALEFEKYMFLFFFSGIQSGSKPVCLNAFLLGFIAHD